MRLNFLSRVPTVGALKAQRFALGWFTAPLQGAATL